MSSSNNRSICEIMDIKFVGNDLLPFRRLNGCSSKVIAGGCPPWHGVGTSVYDSEQHLPAAFPLKSFPQKAFPFWFPCCTVHGFVQFKIHVLCFCCHMPFLHSCSYTTYSLNVVNL